MFNIRKIAWLFVWLPLQLSGQQPPVLSLDTILKHIDRNNLQLQTYDLRAESYQNSADAATAWMPPMAGAGTFMTPYSGQKAMDPRDKGMLMFRVEQQFPNPAKQKAQRRYIQSQANVERASRGVTLNNLRAQAKELYYTWLVAEHRIQILQRSSEIMEMMKKIEEVRYPYNQSGLSNIYEADAKLEENRNMIWMQEGEIARAQARLNGLMNQPSSLMFRIDTTQRPVLTSADYDTTLLAKVRKDVLRMNESIRSMQLNIRSMWVQHRPDFRIQFDHMSPFGTMMPKVFSVMGMVTIPIAPWSSKMYHSDIKAMEYNIQAMERERAAMLQETQGMVYGMRSEIQSMQKRIQAMETKIIPSLHKALDVSILNYKENKLQLPAVMESWEALTMMQMDTWNEKLKLYQMIVDYEKEIYQ